MAVSRQVWLCALLLLAGMTTVVSAICEDDYPNCNDYDLASLCKASFNWAYTNCRASCNMCGISTQAPATIKITTTATSTTTATTLSSQTSTSSSSVTYDLCVDNAPDCNELDLNSICNSPSYRPWMLGNCALSCGLCKISTSPASFIHSTPSTTTTPSGVTYDNCVDNYPECNDLDLATVCRKPGDIPWAHANCALSCGFCVFTTTTSPHSTRTSSPTSTTFGVPHIKTSTTLSIKDCYDNLHNCHEYQADTCTNPAYQHWAMTNCRQFCQLCIGTTTTPVPTTTQSTHPVDGHCFDRATCSDYDITTACCGEFESWARYNCAKTCKFCQPRNPPSRQCKDVDDKCKHYNSDLCTNPLYSHFVKDKCAGTCKVCESPEYVPPCARGPQNTTTTVSSTRPPIPTSSPDACQDVIDCSPYSVRVACCGPYESWARKHCRKHCKFCVPTVPDVKVCTDVDPNCQTYGSDLCTNPNYDRFIHEKCAGTCKTCDRPLFIPHCANTSIPAGSLQECYHDGGKHQQGSMWDTPDCKRRCQCMDALNNNVTCQAIVCPTPVPHCQQIQLPGHCCPILHNCKPVISG